MVSMPLALAFPLIYLEQAVSSIPEHRLWGDEGGGVPLDSLSSRDGPHHLEQYEAFSPVTVNTPRILNTYWHQTHSIVSHTLPIPKTGEPT